MKPVRILIADDNEAMRQILIRKLSWEYDVITAVSDGGAALTEVVRLHPDLALLDISMPVLNGIEVARRIREAGNGVAVIFLTSSTDSDIFQAAKEAGCVGYVHKPRLWTDLIPAIKLALSGAQFVSPGVG